MPPFHLQHGAWSREANTLVNEELTYVWSFPVAALTAGVRDPSVPRPTSRGIREHTLTFVP